MATLIRDLDAPRTISTALRRRLASPLSFLAAPGKGSSESESSSATSAGRLGEVSSYAFFALMIGCTFLV